MERGALPDQYLEVGKYPAGGDSIAIKLKLGCFSRIRSPNRTSRSMSSPSKNSLLEPLLESVEQIGRAHV